MKRFLALALLALGLPLVACRPAAIESPAAVDTGKAVGDVGGAGTVKESPISSCSAWFVDADAGPRYQLTQLAPEFRHSGLRVRFRLKLRPDLVSTCMAGEIADVLSIAKE